MRLVVGLVLVSGCSDGPCGLTRFEDTPAAGPGEVRHGRVDGNGAIAAYPISGDRVLCRGLAVTEDGSALVVLSSHSPVGDSAIRVGSRTLDGGSDSAYYVLNISM